MWGVRRLPDVGLQRQPWCRRSAPSLVAGDRSLYRVGQRSRAGPLGSQGSEGAPSCSAVGGDRRCIHRRHGGHCGDDQTAAVVPLLAGALRASRRSTELGRVEGAADTKGSYPPRMRLIAAREEGIASLPARMVGGWIDGLIVGIVLFLPLYALGNGWAARGLSAGVLGVYLVPPIALRGLTLGSRQVHVAIRTAAGEPPGWLRSAVRWAVPVAVGLATSPVRSPLSELILVAVLFAPALMDRRRRALHDWFSGTVAFRDDSVLTPRPDHIVLARQPPPGQRGRRTPRR